MQVFDFPKVKVIILIICFIYLFFMGIKLYRDNCKMHYSKGYFLVGFAGGFVSLLAILLCILMIFDLINQYIGAILALLCFTSSCFMLGYSSKVHKREKETGIDTRSFGYDVDYRVFYGSGIYFLLMTLLFLYIISHVK